MKKSFLAAGLILSLVASTSMAATKSFWATHTQNDNATDSEFLKEGESETFEIKLGDISKWNIHSAKLWLLAVDDYSTVTRRTGIKITECSSVQGSTNDNCSDANASSGKDPHEFAQITWIEGGKARSYGNRVEIGDFKWYDMNINVASFLSKKDKEFEATVKAVCGDFYYKNARLDIDYDIKPVPVPAAVWLFGSALLGLTGMKRKSLAPAVAV